MGLLPVVRSQRVAYAFPPPNADDQIWVNLANAGSVKKLAGN
jgi:hypothetical protein